MTCYFGNVRYQSIEIHLPDVTCCEFVISYVFNILCFKYVFAFSWLYRIRPSVQHEPFKPMDSGNLSNDWNQQHPNPNQVCANFKS